MTKKMWLVAGSLLCIGAIIGYIIFYNWLPPRTPLKIAQVHSGLNIPRNVNVINFNEAYSFNGEGEIYILIKMNEETTQNIVKQCTKKLYKKLTIENLIADKLVAPSTIKDGYNIHGKDITAIENGYYRLVVTNLQEMDFKIVVLDIEKRELVVYVSIP